MVLVLRVPRGDAEAARIFLRGEKTLSRAHIPRTTDDGEYALLPLEPHVLQSLNTDEGGADNALRARLEAYAGWDVVDEHLDARPPKGGAGAGGQRLRERLGADAQLPAGR